jgi:hypothetical protein
MTQAARRAWWRLKPREIRMLCYLGALLAVVAWKFRPRPWHPAITVEEPHYVILSSATEPQTAETAQALEMLYSAYAQRFGGLPQFQHKHPKLKVKLFKDRAEFRRVNPGLGWAEAFYRRPYCRAYYSAEENNPYHWMLHEAVHQLNEEVAGLALARWLEEGLAEHFSTSRFISNRLAVGRIDLNTYPVWWIDELATSSDLAENLRNGSVIPLRAIITNRGGPSMQSHFNLYYLHWWTLTHFIFESPPHRDQALALVQKGGGLEAFEAIIGPVEKVQVEWHSYVRRLKAALGGGDVRLFKEGRLPEAAK